MEAIDLSDDSSTSEVINLDDDSNDDVIEICEIGDHRKVKNGQYDEIFKECQLLGEYIEKCLDLENTDGMIRVINRCLIPVYYNTSKAYRRHPKFTVLLKRSICKLDKDPDHKFSHLKQLCCDMKAGSKKLAEKMQRDAILYSKRLNSRPRKRRKLNEPYMIDNIVLSDESDGYELPITPNTDDYLHRACVSNLPFKESNNTGESHEIRIVKVEHLNQHTEPIISVHKPTDSSCPANNKLNGYSLRENNKSLNTSVSDNNSELNVNNIEAHLQKVCLLNVPFTEVNDTEESHEIRIVKVEHINPVAEPTVTVHKPNSICLVDNDNTVENNFSVNKDTLDTAKIKNSELNKNNTDINLHASASDVPFKEYNDSEELHEIRIVKVEHLDKITESTDTADKPNDCSTANTELVKINSIVNNDSLESPAINNNSEVNQSNAEVHLHKKESKKYTQVECAAISCEEISSTVSVLSDNNENRTNPQSSGSMSLDDDDDKVVSTTQDEEETGKENEIISNDTTEESDTDTHDKAVLCNDNSIVLDQNNLVIEIIGDVAAEDKLNNVAGSTDNNSKSMQHDNDNDLKILNDNGTSKDNNENTTVGKEQIKDNSLTLLNEKNSIVLDEDSDKKPSPYKITNETNNIKTIVNTAVNKNSSSQSINKLPRNNVLIELDHDVDKSMSTKRQNESINNTFPTDNTAVTEKSINEGSHHLAHNNDLIVLDEDDDCKVIPTRGENAKIKEETPHNTDAKENIISIYKSHAHQNFIEIDIPPLGENNTLLVPHKAEEFKGPTEVQLMLQIKMIENEIAVCKNEVAKLEEQEVDDDSFLSPYIVCEKYKARIVRLYQDLCKLTGEQAIKRREVRLKAANGRSQLCVVKLQELINSKIGRDGLPHFPDFQDVLQCVSEANQEECLGWNRSEIMKEANTLFKYCGRALQQSRMRREWRDMLSLVKSEEFEDPADYDPELMARLQANKEAAVKKENDLLDKYTGMSNLPTWGSAEEKEICSSETDDEAEEIDTTTDQGPDHDTSLFLNNTIEDRELRHNTDVIEIKSAESIAKKLITAVFITPEITEANEDITEANEDITEANEDITEANEDITKANEDITEANEDITKANEDITEANEDITEANEDITEANEDITEANEDITEANEDITDANVDLTEANEDVTKANEDITETNKDITNILVYGSHVKKRCTPIRLDVQIDKTFVKSKNTSKQVDLDPKNILNHNFNLVTKVVLDNIELPKVDNLTGAKFKIVTNPSSEDVKSHDGDDDKTSETDKSPPSIGNIKKEPCVDIQEELDKLGSDFTATVIDIEDPFLVVEISSDSEDDDENVTNDAGKRS